MRSIVRNTFTTLAVAAAVAWIAGSGDLSAHGKGLVKKGGGPAPIEIGPHGGAVIDVGDGHFELTRDGDGALALFRLDSDEKVIPAEDVDSAELYVLTPSGPPGRAAMAAIKGTDEKTPLHFRAAPTAGIRGGYLAIISVTMGETSRNLRFEVTGI